MSYLGNLIFTDVVKDVIGNEPVLDQFDISYDASFYGTMQDDYVTGTMLRVIETKFFTVLSTGSSPRGRVFSKYYAESQPPTDSTFGSNAVKQNPSLAFRQVPWSERVSHTSYRVTQIFDENERYYDSCLPNVAKCFEVDGSSMWTTDELSLGWLSPYRNVVTNKIAYAYFNTYEFANLTNNTWTWSYPYENRFSPLDRTTNAKNSLGLDAVKTQVNTDGTTISISNSVTPISVRGLIPLLVGKNEPQELDPSARNSYRSAGYFGTSSIIMPTDPSFDSTYGYCFTIPCDVNLNEKESHSFLSSYPGVSIPTAEYVTGTLSQDDTVRFLFGFGDVNNMTYGWYKTDLTATTASYTDQFETTDIAANSLGTTYNAGGLKLDWSASATSKNWTTRTKNVSDYADTINYFSGGISANYHFLTGSTGGGKGIYWLSSSAPSNDGILVSDTNTAYAGNMTDPSLPSFDVSSCCVDITSSYPWFLKYKRGVACHQTDGLVVYFSGIPGIPSGEYDSTGLGVIVPVETIVGGGTGTTGAGSAQDIGLITQYDSRVQGVGDNEITGYNAPANPTPFSPGSYRLVFAYVISGGSTTIGDPSVAAIDDLQIVQLKENAFSPDLDRQKLGCNNYPHFRKYACDPRFNPIASGYPTQVSGSANNYQGFNFGVSPVIRGWKYGLVSGFPTYSKAVFRRDRFGQFRDMLEQRHNTKFIKSSVSYFSDEAITKSGVSKTDTGGGQSNGGKVMTFPISIPKPAVEVKFVKQKFDIDKKGIGKIYVETVSASGTVSMNLSTEVTSSQPYFDGQVKLRESQLGISYGSQVFVTSYP